MKRNLLSLALALGAATAFAGTPVTVDLTYSVTEVNTPTEVSSLTLALEADGVALPTDFVVNRKTLNGLTVSNGSSVTYATSATNTEGSLVLTFTPAITEPGTYSISFPEALIGWDNAMKMNSSAELFEAFTIASEAGETVTDELTLWTFLDAGIDPVDTSDPNDWTYYDKLDDPSCSGSVQGKSGTTYNVHGLCQPSNTQFQISYNNSYLTNADAPYGYITKITGAQGAWLSAVPLNSNNYYNAKYISADYTTKEIVPEDPVQYIWIVGQTIDALNIEWSNTLPTGTCKVPEISKNNYSDTRSGTMVSIRTKNSGHTIHYTITDPEGNVTTGEAVDSYQFTITGEPDDVWTVEAYVTFDGWNDSEVEKVTYVIDVPTLNTPSIEVDEAYSDVYQSNCIPVNGVIKLSNYSNYSATGSAINYQIKKNGVSEDVQTSTDQTVSFRAEGNIGDGFELVYWVSCDGWNDSPKVTKTWHLVDNKLTAPTFNPNGGAVLEGTDVTISGAAKGKFIYYRINGGDWVENNVEYAYPRAAKVKITEDCTLEAYCTGGDAATSSYADSEIAAVNFTVEKLQDNEILIDEELLNVVKYQTAAYTYEHACGTYEFYGSGNYEGGLSMSAAYPGSENLTYNNYLRNTTGEQPITAVRVVMNSGAAVAVYLGDKMFEKTVDMYDDDLGGFTILGDHTNAAAKNNEWYVVPEEANSPKFFFVRGCTDTENLPTVSKFIVRYGDTTAVDTLEAEDAAEVYFSIDGTRVDAANLVPGIYVRVKGNKSEKVVIR